jgi:hypothetical protein
VRQGYAQVLVVVVAGACRFMQQNNRVSRLWGSAFEETGRTRQATIFSQLQQCATTVKRPNGSIRLCATVQSLRHDAALQDSETYHISSRR